MAAEGVGRTIGIEAVLESVGIVVAVVATLALAQLAANPH
jgi:hypothetical protein